MERSAADNRSVLSVTSDGAEVGEGLPSTHPGRKEAKGGQDSREAADRAEPGGLEDFHRPGSGPGVCLQRQRGCGMV